MIEHSFGNSFFVGVVVNRDDPLLVGRVQVRIYDLHTDDKVVLPDEDLPWAVPITPITSASHHGVGESPTGVLVGSTVVGFFLDGDNKQIPAYFGTMPGIPHMMYELHDTPLESRGINPIVKGLVTFEPDSPYDAKYPYNKVTTTERGHLIEVDDTPQHERLHVRHRSGTYIEVGPAGMTTEYVVDDKRKIVVKNERDYIRHDKEEVIGNTSIISIGNNSKVDIANNSTIHVVGNINLVCDGSIDVNVKKDFTLAAGGNVKITAKKIDLN